MMAWIKVYSTAGVIFLVLMSISLVESNTIFQVNGFEPAGFVSVKDSLNGSCTNNQGNEIKLYQTDSSIPCSRPFPTTADELQLDDQQRFTIESPELVSYNFWCSDVGNPEKCIAVIMYRLTAVEIEEGLKCSIVFAEDGENINRHPTKVFWTKNGQMADTAKNLTEKDFKSEPGATLSHETVLPLDKESEDAPGTYECVYEYNKQKMKPEKPLLVGEDQPPVVSIEFILLDEESKKTDVGQFVDGQTVIIRCVVRSPMPPEIKWYHNGIELTDQQFRLAQDSNFYNSSFTLHEIDDVVQRGDYTCEASNEIGHINATRTLHIRDKLAPLWPFVGIILEVLLLAACIAVGEKFRKKKLAEKQRKKQFGEQAPGPSGAHST